jgi:hypothetical protein
MCRAFELRCDRELADHAGLVVARDGANIWVGPGFKRWNLDRFTAVRNWFATRNHTGDARRIAALRLRSRCHSLSLIWLNQDPIVLQRRGVYKVYGETAARLGL